MIDQKKKRLFSASVYKRASQVALMAKDPPAKAGDIRDVDFIFGSGRSPGGGHGNPLEYSCLENPMDREAWRLTVHRVASVGLKRLGTQAVQKSQVFLYSLIKIFFSVNKLSQMTYSISDQVSLFVQFSIFIFTIVTSCTIKLSTYPLQLLFKNI